MRLSLRVKLSVAFVLLSLLSVLLVGFFSRQVTGTEFDRFRLERDQITLSATLADYFALQGSWDGVERFLNEREKRPRAGQNPRSKGPRNLERGLTPTNSSRIPFPFVLTNSDGIILVGTREYPVGTQLSDKALEGTSPLELEDRTVGRLKLLVEDVPLNPRVLDPRELEFLDRINRALLLGGLATTLLALLLGILFSSWLLTPLRGLMVSLRRMQGGQLEQSLPIRSRDEVGELVGAFNAMSAEVARSQTLRRQMTADIAHDLKTPLTVILGHLEGLRDGVFKPNPQRFETLHFEAKQLERLVSDLRILSLADAGELPLHLEKVSLELLLSAVLSSFEELAQARGVALKLELDGTLPTLELDPQRMSQVLGNLLENALRHTLPGESVTLGGLVRRNRVRLFVRDTGRGIAPEKLTVIFERFYRADEARVSTPEGGSSGLGLAISRALVVAQRGILWAESAGLGQGSVFWLEFPLEDQT